MDADVKEPICTDNENKPVGEKCSDCDFCLQCPPSRCNMCRPQNKKKKKAETDEESEKSGSL